VLGLTFIGTSDQSIFKATNSNTLLVLMPLWLRNLYLINSNYM